MIPSDTSPSHSDDRTVRANWIQRHEAARSRRAAWESLWQDCYDVALPAQGAGFASAVSSVRRGEQVYDATALDAVDQLAASLLGHLTPPWTPWFGFRPGPDLSEAQGRALAPVLEDMARTMHHHFDRSNFAVEIHQCFLDLVVGGTACLAFEESAPGDFTAFRFAAVPLSQVALEEGADGALDGTFRSLSLTLD
ncbi:MAG TPA: portal protein, partial [Alphaproteobacteria bacterium]|nr:portal protein [Alphaproteobacteria bacterium]